MRYRLRSTIFSLSIATLTIAALLSIPATYPASTKQMTTTSITISSIATTITIGTTTFTISSIPTTLTVAGVTTLTITNIAVTVTVVTAEYPAPTLIVVVALFFVGALLRKLR